MLIVVTVLLAVIALLGMTVRRLRRSNLSTSAYAKQLALEQKHLEQRFCIVIDAVERTAGGVSKRLSENTEITTTIACRAPDLFGREPGLRHWLRANDQFYIAVIKALDDAHQMQAKHKLLDSLRSCR